MSKATESADASSAPTVESPTDTEPSVEPQGTARALTVRDTSHTDPLYGTDRATARAIISKGEDHDATAFTDIKVGRYGELLQVNLYGTVTLSYNDVRRAINTDVYEVKNFLSHASGSVTVTLKTP